MSIPSPAAPRRFRPARGWSERVVDHRPVASGMSGLPPVPETLPVPGCKSANALWDRGVAEFDLPDTSHLPSGGPGGTLSVAAHVLPRVTAHGEGSVATVITYPDGYRLGSLWAASGATTTETWRTWMNGLDGMGHAFTRVATPWSVAQRAWAARRWYDFAAAAPDGVGLTASEWNPVTRGVTRGLLGAHNWRLAETLSPQQITAIQQAGFWLPDPEQTRWLDDGDTPLASFVPDDTFAAAPAAERLHRMYTSGWTTQARRDWPARLSHDDAAVHLRDFIDATCEWDDVIISAWTLLREKENRAASALDVTTSGSSVGDCGSLRTGEIASLCLRLGFTPFHVGVMVGEGSFDVEALRTMVALRETTPA